MTNREPTAELHGSLDGTVSMVTGGSRGIGAAIARHLGALGSAVGVVYKRDGAAAADIVAAMEEAGISALSVQADIADAGGVDRAFTDVEERLGPIGILVNNAGLHRGGRIAALAVEDWQAVLDTNLTGPFLCCRRAVPKMIERGGGRILNVSSVVGLNGFPGDSAYASVKAGLIGLTRALALELAGDGISVNALAPGFVDTEMTRGLRPHVLDRVVSSIPAGHQVSSGVGHLVDCGLAAGPSYLTGATLVVDGGWSIA
jgi:3-oxoacyl-[acyl-carrier protein] reductase